MAKKQQEENMVTKRERQAANKAIDNLSHALQEIAAPLPYTIHKCTRCHHEWPTRNPAPLICPKCKSPYWNRERKTPKGEAGT